MGPNELAEPKEEPNDEVAPPKEPAALMEYRVFPKAPAGELK